LAFQIKQNKIIVLNKNCHIGSDTQIIKPIGILKIFKEKFIKKKQTNKTNESKIIVKANVISVDVFR
jgi:hypothetical protein